jgi:phage/conjugal plasmid C-4 type zinc finger TraR family protein
MPDFADRASMVADEHLRVALASVRTQNKCTRTRGVFECVECGVEIPAERRTAVPGCTCCVVCQEINEKK